MSTKIYRGRRLAAPIGVIYELLIQAKGQASLLGIHIQAETLAANATKLIDEARIAGRDLGTPLADAYRKLRADREAILTTRERNPDADFEFELWLFPKGKITLCMVNTEQAQFLEWFDDLPFVSDHSYWNGSDRPDSVTPKQWAQRKADWNDVLPGAGVPNHRCLRLQMFDHHAPLPFDVDAIAQFAPDVESRLETHARQIHRDEAYKRIIAENPSETPDAMHSIFENIRKAEKEIDTNPQRTAEIRSKLASKILPITADDLRPKQPEGVEAIRKSA